MPLGLQRTKWWSSGVPFRSVYRWKLAGSIGCASSGCRERRLHDCSWRLVSCQFSFENGKNDFLTFNFSPFDSGNNTLGECFYFGVPVIVTPIVGDQIANAKRVTETGYGYSIDLRNLGETELAEKLEKLLNDEGLRRKWTEASRRIQSENRIGQIAQRVFEYINQIKKWIPTSESLLVIKGMM